MSDTSSVQRGEITQEVVSTLVDLMAETIGRRAVDIVLKQFPADEQPSGRDLVFRFAEETDKLLGTQGAYAVLRQVGRDLAKRVAATRPKEEWSAALAESLNSFGFADGITREEDHADICNCVFYSILEKRGLNPTGHAVCWAGWGFIEGFMKLMGGVRSIRWVGRDMERKACVFEYQTATARPARNLSLNKDGSRENSQPVQLLNEDRETCREVAVPH